MRYDVELTNGEHEDVGADEVIIHPSGAAEFRVIKNLFRDTVYIINSHNWDRITPQPEDK